MPLYPYMRGQRPGAALWIKNPDGKVFFQQRDSGPSIAPLQYALWGGAIDPGETPEEAAAREMFEELTMQEVLYPFSQRHEMTIESEHGVFNTYMFEVSKPVTWANFRIQEGAGGSFFTLEEAMKMNLADMAVEWVQLMQGLK